MPRSASMVGWNYMFGAAAALAESPSQVAPPNSPGCATVWNRQINLPVSASKPRTSPLGPSLSVSWHDGTADDDKRRDGGGEVMPYPRPETASSLGSITPSRRIHETRPCRKESTGFPVAGSIAQSCPSSVP